MKQQFEQCSTTSQQNKGNPLITYIQKAKQEELEELVAQNFAFF